MTRFHCSFLVAVLIVMMLAAGCTNPNASNAPPLVTTTGAPAATPEATAPAASVTTQPGTTATQASGTCSANINSDAANCGGCGYACPANAECQQGQCFCKDGFTVENNACVVMPVVSGNGCPAGMSPCSDGYCYELTSSADNCGICGNKCPSGMICSASTCTNVPTESTTAPVTSTVSPTETVTVTDTLGGLHVSCIAFGKTDCGGTCVNLSTSNGNCGSCGNICSGLTATCCGGSCTSLKTDESNCGSCGHKCGAWATCEAGSCKVNAVVTGHVLVTPKVSLKVTVPPQYKQPVLDLPGNI